jgi:hypothetical protein
VKKGLGHEPPLPGFDCLAEGKIAGRRNLSSYRDIPTDRNLWADFANAPRGRFDCSNIAEGQGRLTKGEFQQFLGHSRGSLLELETQVAIAVDLHYLTESESTTLEDRTSEVRRLLNSLINSLRAKSKDATN